MQNENVDFKLKEWDYDIWSTHIPNTVSQNILK